MKITRTALVVLGLVLIVAIDTGKIEILIPILGIIGVLMAIIAFSPIGRAIANSISGNTSGVVSGVSYNEFNQLKDKYDRLEKRFDDYDDEMNKMREALIFSDNKKIMPFSANSEEHKINLNKQINLEKTL